MNCILVREAISARLDGEALGIPEAELEKHVYTCVECRSFSSVATSQHRSLRVTVAPPVPDLTSSVLHALGNREEDRAAHQSDVNTARQLLVFAALLQVALTAPGLLGDAVRPLHLDHELGAWDLALAFGLLFAAWRPERAWGMLPLVAAVAVGLAATTAIDVMGGRVALTNELAHSSEVIGVFFLWNLARVWRHDPSDPTGLPFQGLAGGRLQ